MTNPDPSTHNPDPQYIRHLIERAGLSQRKAAHAIGVTERMMRYYCMSADHPSFTQAPYTVQFALENLPQAEGNET